MLTKLSVKGFKTLKDFSISLARVSVLVGPNNCGKSNVLRALALLGDSQQLGLNAAIEGAGGPADVFTRSGDRYLEIAVQAVFEGTTVHYNLRSDGRSGGQEQLWAQGDQPIDPVILYPGTSPLTASGKAGPGLGKGLYNFAHKRKASEPVRRLCDLLDGLSVADLSMDRLRAKSLPAPGVQLQSNGENLAAVLDRLHGEQPSVRKRIEREISEVVPTITGIVTPTVDNEGYKVVGVAEGDEVFRAHAVSDGILLFLALSTVSQMSGGRALVCLEEPDKGIHPRRIKEILEQINRVAATGSQFILTTHSPVLLNEFRDFPEAVLILDRTESGGTRAKALSSLPDIQEQLREVSLGDLWYSGVLGGVPSK